MDRDDYISKLFIKNQDKLNEAPSADFWSKLEAQLDEKMPVEQSIAPKTTPKIIPFSRYMAAASVVVAVFALVYWVQFTSNVGDNTVAIVLEAPIEIPLDDSEPYENADVLPSNLSPAIAEQKELKALEDKIVKEVNDKLPTANITGLNDINLAEENEDLSNIIIVPETDDVSTTNANSSGAGTSAGDFESVVIQNASKNYASSIPQLSNIGNNNAYADQVLKNADIKLESAEDIASARGKQESRKARGVMPNTEAKDKSTKVKSPMATAHARLQPFGFLLGRWIDDNEKEGTSYETWSLKDANTLTGKGYKLGTNNDRIFEEMMRIEFRNNQVFLVMSLAETGGTMDYMMTKFDNEHFVFEQTASNKYPDKVVIQRTLDGYTTIILNNSNFLTSEQQRYLENRNRVSNVRAVRTMRSDVSE